MIKKRLREEARNKYRNSYKQKERIWKKQIP